jgi:hypothetical protein
VVVERVEPQASVAASGSHQRSSATSIASKGAFQSSQLKSGFGEFGCATIGIQYQQGLKDLCPASDLVEGTLNNVDRPPVFREGTREELYKGQALPHFNEVDECAGIDGLVTDRLWRQLGYSPENTLHDLRWGRQFSGKVDGKKLDAYVWVFLISGAAPPAVWIPRSRYSGSTISAWSSSLQSSVGGSRSVTGSVSSFRHSASFSLRWQFARNPK